MGLPAAVQRQLDYADELVNQINGQPDGETAEAETDEPTQPEQAAQPPAPAPEAPKPTVAEETWERRYASLKGMFDAEVPRLHATVKELTGKVNLLSADLEAARAKPPEPKELVTQADKETFGEDLSGFIERAAKQATLELAQENANLKSRLAKLEGSVGAVQETTQEALHNDYLAHLARLVPDWESQNTDPAFIAWLEEVDPVYGVPRQAALTTAFQNRDAARTANIFRAFRPEAPAPKPSQSPNLARQTAPTRTRSAAPPQSNEAPSFTESQVSQFYREFNAGRMSAADFASGEALINAAAAAGRIRPG